MKKLALITIVSVVAAFGAQAQGVIFGNSASATSKISTNGIAVGLTDGTVANSFYYALFSQNTSGNGLVNGSTAAVQGYGATQNYVWADLANWTFDGMATNTASAGRVQGVGTGTGGSTTIPNVAGGAQGKFLVLGWSSNLGSTYSAVQALLTSQGSFTGNGWIGQSVVSGLVTTGDGGSIPSPTILAASGAVTGFQLGLVTATPEPGTIALAGLGGLSLLALRRKK